MVHNMRGVGAQLVALGLGLSGVAVVLDGAGVARAAEPPNPTCVAVCMADAGTPEPVCEACEPTNVCSDLASTDRPAYDACVAEHHACYQASHDCQQGAVAGRRAQASCVAAGATAASCCASACAPALVVEPSRSAGRWIFVDLVIAGLLRHVPGDYSGAAALGLSVESLFGARSWRGSRVPFRLGPSGQALLTIKGDESEDVGLQLSAALTALLYARRRGLDTFSKAVTLSAGVLADLPPEAENRVGGLLRLSLGVTTTGRNEWKFISGWVFAEGHYIPGGADEPDRVDVMLGLRLAPLVIPMAFIPNAQDR